MVLSKVLPRVKAAIRLVLSHEASSASPRYFFATYCCNFLTPLGLSAKRIPDAAAICGLARYWGIFSHQLRAKRKSCSKLAKNSVATRLRTVFAPSLMPCPSLKTTSHPKVCAISLVLSELWSSAIIRSLTNLLGITSLIRLNTRGSVSAPFLVHITKSTLSVKDNPSTFGLYCCPHYINKVLK